MELFVLAMVAGLMQAAISFAPTPGTGSGPGGTALACGYLILSGFLAGTLFKRAGLPRLTGYMVVGLLGGPHVAGLVSGALLQDLRVFNGVAIALIALTAGSEIDLRAMKAARKTIGLITVISILGTALVLALAVFAGHRLLPFTAGMNRPQLVAVAAVLATTMVAQSPAVVVALHDEMRCEGPLSRTVLGTVVLSDLVVILCFTVSSTLARMAFGASADALHAAGRLVWQLFGSVGIGIGIGVLVATYLQRVRAGEALFVVTVAFVVAQVGRQLALDPLLIALAAGMFIRNATATGHSLHRHLAIASPVVYVVFFALAGASIHLGALRSVAIPAVALVSLRAAGFLVGTPFAARLAKAPKVVERYAGFGLVPQSGLALALALLFVRTFPEFGAGATALVFGAVAINELVAPVLYRHALVRSGEARASAVNEAAAQEARAS
jgi:Kef-type K+ transport system membrane component KefB